MVPDVPDAINSRTNGPCASNSRDGRIDTVDSMCRDDAGSEVYVGRVAGLWPITQQ
jgi:hypothetical protein